MRVGGRVFEAVRAELRSEAETSRLVIPTLKARCCDGTITGSGTVDPAEQRYRLSLSMDDADLSQLLRDPEKTETPARPSSAASGGDAAAMEGDAAGGSPQVDGLVTASLGLDGSWGEDAGWRGQGKLRVYDASLEGVPMSMGLLHMAHLRLPVEDEFESAEMRFHLRGSRMLFERIELGAASSMRFAGRGSVDYDAERLDLTLTTSNPAGLDLGPLTELIDGFRNQLITLGITGSLDQPEVRVRQLSGLDRVWRDVFGDEPSWDGEG
jgi:hypothetical protein